jgi:lysine-N-methylase
LKSIPLARVPSAAVEADNQHLDARGSLIHPWFLAIRSAAIELVLDRAYPLWQRLFLLGILCRRLDEIVSGELQSDIPSFLAGFERAVASGSLRRAMEKQPADRKAQLDAVLRLAGMLLHKSVVLPRFVGCIQAFATGIGNGPTATLESLTAQYKLSHNRYFAPFFQRNPQILENYLVNTIVRCQFPFGRDAIKNGSTPLMTKEFALLTAQFALMKGLLIGVAGFHREQFSAEHVVHTVQAAAKHFDHHPEFLRLAYELLVESRLDGAQGMAILLRDSDPAAPRPASPPKHVPLPQAGLGRKALPV